MWLSFISIIGIERYKKWNIIGITGCFCERTSTPSNEGKQLKSRGIDDDVLDAAPVRHRYVGQTADAVERPVGGQSPGHRQGVPDSDGSADRVPPRRRRLERSRPTARQSRIRLLQEGRRHCHQHHPGQTVHNESLRFVNPFRIVFFPFSRWLWRLMFNRFV